MKRFKIFFLMMLTFAISTKAQQTTFSKGYPFPNHASIFFKATELNNKYFAVGWLNNIINATDDGFLVGTDVNGNTLFKNYIREVDSIQYFLLLKSIQKYDNSLYASGFVGHIDTTFTRGYTQDPILIKFDTLGNRIWYRNDYRSGVRNFFSSTDLDIVGNQLIHTGSTVYEATPGVSKKQNSVVIWMDTSGNVLRNKEYSLFSNFNFEVASDFEPLIDGGFVLSGQLTNNGNGGQRNGFLMRADSLGNKIWAKSYGEQGRLEDIYSTTVLSDGNYLATGWRARDENITGESAAWDGWLLKINSQNGDTIWTRTLNAAFFNAAIKSYELQNGDLMVGGEGGFAGDSANGDAQIMRLTANGDKIWAKRYGWPYDPVTLRVSAENIYGFNQTSDGGYMIIGDGVDFASGNRNQIGWLLKLDSNGCLVSGCGSVGITEYEVFNVELNAYPNPAQDVLNVKGNLQSGDIIALYDYTGKQVLQYAVAAGEEMQLNTGNLATGIYLLRLNRNNRSMSTKRVMINR